MITVKHSRVFVHGQGLGGGARAGENCPLFCVSALAKHFGNERKTNALTLSADTGKMEAAQASCEANEPIGQVAAAAKDGLICLQENTHTAERYEAHRLILESAGEGIYGIDADGVMTFANPAAEAMTGWKTGELIGKPQHATIHHSHADGSHYPAELCPIYGSLREGLAHYCDTEVFWRKDGTCFPVAYTSTPIVLDGRPSGAVILFQDVTSRKRREAWEAEKTAIFTGITSHQELDTTLAMITSAAKNLFPESSIALLRRTGNILRLVAHTGIPESLRLLLSNVSLSNLAFACSRAAQSSSVIACDSRSDENGASGKKMSPVEDHSAVIEAAPLISAPIPSNNAPPPAPLLLPDSFRCMELAESGFTTCRATPLLSTAGAVLGVVAFFDKAAVAERYGVPPPLSAVCDLARLAIEHQLLHSELLRQSQHDHLTGLPNRVLLEDRLSRALVHARRHGTQVAVCHLDLDYFKQINDTLGHTVGDCVLKHVATVLRQTLKEIDTVARQGGDEFILILSDLKSEAEADVLCERILAGIRQPFEEAKQTIVLGASVGRSMYPQNADTPAVLLQEADLALYAAKYCGRNRLQVFNDTLGERIQREIEMQWELRFALDRQQLHLMYQPLFNILGRLVGFEALLRWLHPKFGAINPEVFIPIAEKTGLILPIGAWVLETACHQAKIWNTGASDPIRISVNVSAVQLGHVEFTTVIDRALERTGLSAALLDLEITETSLIADTGAASGRLRELRTLGVHISMDDFGCGHSSFSYLQTLPIDTIKIDRSFIAPLDGTEKKSAIVRTIVALARQLGLQTVAEGVETEKQMEELQTTDCGLLQGYYLSKPLTPEAAQQLVIDGIARRGRTDGHDVRDGSSAPDPTAQLSQSATLSNS